MAQPPAHPNGPQIGPGQPPPSRRLAPSPMSGHHVGHSHTHGHPPQMLRTGTNNQHSHNHIHTELDSVSHIPPTRFVDLDWEAKERELEEARARAAQMEKTMRWWSDCTANWREKWSKVRIERNRSREEAKILRAKLEMALKDCSSLRREKQAIEQENEFLRTELGRFSHSLINETPERNTESPFKIQPRNNDDVSRRVASPETACETYVEKSDSTTSSLSPRARLSPSVTAKILQDLETACLSGAVPKQLRSSVSLESPVLETDDIEYLQHKLSHLKLRLDEATKTIHAERDEKGSLHKNMESMQLELLDLRSRVEELKCSKQELERQLLSIQESHRQQIHTLQQDQRDEANTRETLDRRLAELRSELERLQTENAAEWGRRERVETERQALERENKKLRTSLSDLQERLERKNAGLVSSVAGSGQLSPESELSKIQLDLDEKAKELVELKHAHNKLKKALQDRSVELGHALRRAEHSEAEVRRLRSRIDELKREVAAAQDELDAATNNVRKLQRTNEELQEQIDSLQIQVTHLQTRLRNSNSNGTSFLLRESLLQDTLSEDENNEF